jgi:hypothetical protein
MVAPLVFFDQMCPTVLPVGTGLDVRPHPHIGLATVTYLFDGEILHRDSLGTVQPIRPGGSQLDDGRARDRALRAQPTGAAERRRPALRHPDLGRAAEGPRRE